jgi:hypothetical protein
MAELISGRKPRTAFDFYGYEKGRRGFDGKGEFSLNP